MAKQHSSRAEELGVGPAWEPILTRIAPGETDLKVWRRRFITETEPLTVSALRMVALRMLSLGPSLIANRTDRSKPVTNAQLDRLCLAAALRYTNDDAGPRWRLTAWGSTGRSLVRDGIPTHTNGVTQRAFDDLWARGQSLEEIANALGLGRRAANSYLHEAKPRWFGKDVAAHFGWSRENHRLRLARGHFPPPDGRDRHSDWWWPATVAAWAATQRLTTCPRCDAKVSRLAQHMTKHAVDSPSGSDPPPSLGSLPGVSRALRVTA